MDQLTSRDLALNAVIVGGAAVALGVRPDRQGTTDIDAFAKIDKDVQAVINEIASVNDLPENWFNANAQMFMSGVAAHDDLPVVVAGSEKVTIYRLDNASLLAMKLRAGRPAKDGDDIIALFQALELRTIDDAQAVLDSYYGGEEEMAPASEAILEAHIRKQ